MAIEDWMPALKTVLEGVEGVEQVHIYNDLPGVIVVFPSMIVLPVAGDQMVSAGGVNISHHQVQVTLYLANQVLPEALGLGVPFIKKVLEAVAGDIRLGGRVAHCMPVSPPQTWYSGPGRVMYGDALHSGIVFRLDVKEGLSLTVS
ncbi:MAG: hypothetical protein C4570_03415 [Ammonifex sp.]|nr:MAG: hypothetical protein C4570_03415 [Ammonifex sp.]